MKKNDKLNGLYLSFYKQADDLDESLFLGDN